MCAFFRTETPGNLLLHLGHSDIILTKVIGEWNNFIVHESQHNAAFQPHSDQLQNGSVRYPTFKALHQLALVNRVKITAQIRIKNFQKSCLECSQNLGKRVMGLTPGAESVRAVLPA